LVALSKKPPEVPSQQPEPVPSDSLVPEQLEPVPSDLLVLEQPDSVLPDPIMPEQPEPAHSDPLVPEQPGPAPTDLLAQGQPEQVPSDILVLEAQDLIQDIPLTEPSTEDADVFEAEVAAEENVISIELEELDISKIDQLVESGDGSSDLIEDGPTDSPAIFLDTAPGDFGSELTQAMGQTEHLSPIASELLSDHEFIKALAKEVAKTMDLRDTDA